MCADHLTSPVPFHPKPAFHWSSQVIFWYAKSRSPGPHNDQSRLRSTVRAEERERKWRLRRCEHTTRKMSNPSSVCIMAHALLSDGSLDQTMGMAGSNVGADKRAVRKTFGGKSQKKKTPHPKPRGKRGAPASRARYTDKQHSGGHSQWQGCLTTWRVKGESSPYFLQKASVTTANESGNDMCCVRRRMLRFYMYKVRQANNNNLQYVITHLVKSHKREHFHL